MEEPRFHLVDDFGVSKKTIARNFDAEYGHRNDPWANRVRALLSKTTEFYTLDEMEDLIKALSSAHIERMVKGTGDYADSYGPPTIEVWESEQALAQQAELEERLRIFRARAEQGTPFRGVPLPQNTVVIDRTMTMIPAIPVQPQRRLPNLRKESLTPSVLAIVGLIAFSVIVLGFLIGTMILSPSSTPATPPASFVADDGNWARIQTAGKITVGTAGDYPPFSYHGKNLALDGFDIQVMNEIGKRFDLQVVYVDIPFDGLTGALQVEQIDAAIAAISVTPEREGYADFTTVYFVGEDGVIARQDSNLSEIRSADDMAKLRVGVQRGSVYETWLTTSLVNTGKMPLTNFFAYTQADQALDDLKANRLDVVVMDYLPAQDAVKQGGIKLVGHGLAKQNYAIQVRQGSLSLRNSLNQALAQMQSDGTIARLAQQYLGVAPGPINPASPSTPVPTAVPPPCVDSLVFIQHLTLEDRNMTVFATMNPGQAFTKSWRVGNVGTCAWNSSYSVNFVQGNVDAARMGGTATKIERVVQRNDTYDLQIQLYAPIVPGTYQAWWEMRNAQGVALGQRLSVGIQVPPPATPTPLPTQTSVPGINFSVDRTSIKAGERVALAWNVTNVKAIYLYIVGEPWEQRGVSGQGSRQVYLQNTTVYELRVVKPDDQVETRQIRIDVTPLPPTAPTIARFTVDPGFQIFLGQCVNLTWDVQGDVAKVTLTGNDAAIWESAPVRGTQQNCPSSVGVVSYVIDVTGPGGSTRSQRDITVVAQPTATPPPTTAPFVPTPTPQPPTPTVPPVPVAPIINVFTINPGAVTKQQCATLAWDVSGNVNSVRIFRSGIVILDNGMLAGTAQECPTASGNLTYRIEARNLAGLITTRELTLIVNP
jgi:ABC-type amino acid transport substrate-binding protein